MFSLAALIFSCSSIEILSGTRRVSSASSDQAECLISERIQKYVERHGSAAFPPASWLARELPAYSQRMAEVSCFHSVCTDLI